MSKYGNLTTKYGEISEYIKGYFIRFVFVVTILKPIFTTLLFNVYSDDTHLDWIWVCDLSCDFISIQNVKSEDVIVRMKNYILKRYCLQSLVCSSEDESSGGSHFTENKAYYWV